MQRSPKETSVKLAVNLGGLAMKNPVTTASGTFGAGREYHDFVDVAARHMETTFSTEGPWQPMVMPPASTFGHEMFTS